jgi:hypothetical protein
MLNFLSDQSNNLLSNITSMRNSYVRSIRVALAVFLVKMRLGVSNRVLASLFHLKNKRVVSRIVLQRHQTSIASRDAGV